MPNAIKLLLGGKLSSQDACLAPFLFCCQQKWPGILLMEARGNPWP